MNVEQWDGPALVTLFEHGAASASELSDRNPVDQFVPEEAAAWVVSAEGRGLIEVTGGSGPSTRYNITDAGRKLIGNPR
jgi:hypothetical protein